MKLTNTFRCVAIIGLFLSSTVTGCKESNHDKNTNTPKDTATTATTIANNPYKAVDKSPLDIIYCPDEFPQKKMKGEIVGSPVARVIYSRPHKKGRIIFSADSNSLCPYGKPWRLGANEATEIELFRPALVNGNNITAGRYIVYGIPHEDKWEIIFNTNLNSWGLDIDRSKDIFKAEVPVQVQYPEIEDFTMVFQETEEGAELLMAWDNVKVSLPFTFSK